MCLQINTHLANYELTVPKFRENIEMCALLSIVYECQLLEHV
jgi:hypothetical protein